MTNSLKQKNEDMEIDSDDSSCSGCYNCSVCNDVIEIIDKSNKKFIIEN